MTQNRLWVDKVSSLAMGCCFDLTPITSREFRLEECTLRVIVRAVLLLLSLLVHHKALSVTSHHGLLAILPVLFEVERLAHILIGRGLRIGIPSIGRGWRANHLRLDN